jgi:hypothetical protein
MTRSVITYDLRRDSNPDLAPKPGEPRPLPEDKYKDRLLKYIPAEVVTLYLTLTALLGTARVQPWWLGWLILAVGIVATWYYLRYPLEVKDRKQLIISCVAFVVWAFALGGPFKDLSWYNPVHGGLLLTVYTFFIANQKTTPRAGP